MTDAGNNPRAASGQKIKAIRAHARDRL